jgi:hypothetical protein
MGKAKIDTKENESKGQELKLPCTECATRTHHIVLQSVDVSGEEDLDDDRWYGWYEIYQIVQCQGCKSITFRRAYANSEDHVVDEYDSEPKMLEYLYPNRVEGRKALRDLHMLPRKVLLIYDETHKALSEGLSVLTGVGLRAIIETVCKDKAATGKDLNRKIDDLVTKGMLTREGADILHKLRVLGNKAAHDVKPHSRDQLALAMDVAEHLLKGAYVFPRKAAATFK